MCCEKRGYDMWRIVKGCMRGEIRNAFPVRSVLAPLCSSQNPHEQIGERTTSPL